MAGRKKSMLKNQSGEGSFTMLDSGKLEYRFYYKDEYGNRKRKSVTGIDERDCIMKAEQWIDRVECARAGIDLEATIPSILYERHLADYQRNYIREQGYGRNVETVRRIENSAIGNIPISEIRMEEIDMFLRSMTKYSNSVIQKIYRQLKLAFAIAVESGLVQENLMLSRNLRCPKSSKEDIKVRGLTVEEQSRLVDVLENKTPPNNRNDYRLQLLIELYSGMRMGEINALRKRDIDLKGGTIHIRGTVSIGIDGRVFVKRGTKTRTGVRDIPISRKLRPYLEKALQQQKENPEDLVFYDYNKGNVISTQQVNCYYHRLCKAAKVPCMGQHALRHTFATRCIESGISAVVLKNWLGHKDIHMTLDIYTDVFSSMNNGALEMFDDYVDQMMCSVQE